MKEHVPRDDELRLAIAPCCVRRKRIVARHVGMNDFDPVLRDEARQLVRAGNVERVAQRQRLDFVAREFQVTCERRLRPQHGIHVVPARDERVRQIRDVTLAAAERCC